MKADRPPPPRWVALARALMLALALCASLTTRARAHDPFEITSVAVVYPQALQLEVTMRRSVIERLAAAGIAPAAADVALGQAAIDALAEQLFSASSNGEPLPFVAHRVSSLPESELEFRLEFAAPKPGRLRLEARHLRVLPEGYLNAVSLRAQSTAGVVVLGQKFLHAAEPVFEVSLPPADSGAPGEAAAPAEKWTALVARFVKLGMHHVVTGYDHLLFLLGVLIPCRRVRTLVGLVTCFTLAHSATLLLSVLAVVSVPSRIVEPLIAASIIYVGCENLFSREEPRARYAVTFAFGLVHGLGFAAALGELELGQERILALFSFNLGVELAQVAIAAPLLPLLAWARKFPVSILATRALSLAIVLAGAYWLVERTLLA